LTTGQLREAVLAALADVAPEADLGRLAGSAELREELDLDSMDFLNFVTGVHERTGIEVPEADYGKLSTLDGCLDYLAGPRRSSR
jgi:acyl carrier protein